MDTEKKPKNQRCYMPDQPRPARWRKSDIVGIDMGDHVITLVVKSVRAGNVPVYSIPTTSPQPWLMAAVREYKTRIHVPTKAQIEGMVLVKRGKQPSDVIKAELWRANLVCYLPKTFDLVLTKTAKTILKKCLDVAKNK